MKVNLLLCLAIGGLAGCQPLGNIVVSHGAATFQDRQMLTAAARSVILSGQVVMPSAFAVQAVPADVAGQATVTMSAVGGEAVCAGLTDATGHFTLYQSSTPFVPVAGGFYKLDFTKRLTGGPSRNQVSLRTTVRWTGTAWESISGGTIMVSALTTAISRIEEVDPAVQPDTIMNVVAVTDTTVTTDGFSTYTPTAIADEEAKVLDALAHDRDPLGDWCPPPPPQLPPPPPGAPTPPSPPPPPPDCVAAPPAP